MTEKIILYSVISGITVFIGGLLANLFNHHIKETPVKYEIIHGLMSFGAGIILSGLALVLVPKGLEELELVPLVISFLFGAVLFMYIDWYLSRKGGQMATLLAMMMDFVPESIVLGATFALEPKIATLLAVFIGLQNLPEAFNAYRDLVQSGFTVRKTLVIFFFLSFSGVVGAMAGHFYLSDYPDLTAYLMIFSSGGILYLLIQDIIPKSKLKNNYFSSLGATLGFLVGIIGEKII
jgi:ZIP family zinc transporter